jgi:D-glycero-D-manno-heptose 1,7-bisphosphate phosphatase
MLEGKKALLLDRDGVIIEYIPYLSKPEQVKIPEDAGIALKKWQDAGYILTIFTNQSGVGRGYFTMNDVEAVHQRIFAEYAQFGVHFQKVLICPHQPQDNCDCRKPSPYLLKEYAQQSHINLAESFFIGDAPSDLECAIGSGCQPILLLTGRGKETVQNLSNYKVKITVFNNLKNTISLLKK